LVEKDSTDVFFSQNDDEQEHQQALTYSVNQRLQKAMLELKDKHDRGVPERDHPDRAPTGAMYKQTRQAIPQQNESKQTVHTKSCSMLQSTNNNNNHEQDVDSDDEWLDQLENDPALEALREQRLQQMRQEHLQKLQHKGHGEYRTIAQDDFLPECTGSSEWVVVHFFQDEFERCKIMDHHLQLVAQEHIECKFLRMEASKAPFFCTKLKITTLPTVLVFQQGKTVHRLVGFEGISENNEWPTRLLQEWLYKTGCIHYKPPPKELEEEMNRLGISSVWRGGVGEYDEDM
jgi:thiol-disulfide isomerase/thioredoxin